MKHQETTRYSRRDLSAFFTIATGSMTVAVLLALAALPTFSNPLLNTTTTPSEAEFEHEMNDCLTAAKNTLGANADILRCGDLNDPNVLEAVAALRKNAPGNEKGRILVSRLVILRRERSSWLTALDVSREIKNTEGFIGIDYIDDYSPLWAYSVQFYESLPGGKKCFVISLAYITDERDTNEVPVDISWDPSVGRYREFSLNFQPTGFKPELRNPPHHTR
jgi:hypothetical protein